MQIFRARLSAADVRESSVRLFLSTLPKIFTHGVAVIRTYNENFHHYPFHPIFSADKYHSRMTRVRASHTYNNSFF